MLERNHLNKYIAKANPKKHTLPQQKVIAEVHFTGFDHGIRKFQQIETLVIYVFARQAVWSTPAAVLVGETNFSK